MFPAYAAATTKLRSSLNTEFPVDWQSLVFCMPSFVISYSTVSSFNDHARPVAPRRVECQLLLPQRNHFKAQVL